MKKLSLLFALAFVILSCKKDDDTPPKNPLFGTWKPLEWKEKNSDGTWPNQWTTSYEEYIYIVNETIINNTDVDMSIINGTYTIDPTTLIMKINFPTANRPNQKWKITNLTPTEMTYEILGGDTSRYMIRCVRFQ